MSRHTCPECNGYQGEPGSNYNQAGWHVCHRCQGQGTVTEESDAELRRQVENDPLNVPRVQSLFGQLRTFVADCFTGSTREMAPNRPLSWSVVLSDQLISNQDEGASQQVWNTTHGSPAMNAFSHDQPVETTNWWELPF